jgi:hypothetical protein
VRLLILPLRRLVLQREDRLRPARELALRPAGARTSSSTNGVAGEVFASTLRAYDRGVFAHIVRYEVGREENATSFVDEVIARFDAMQDELPSALGSLLLTRRDDGEALQIVFFNTEDEALDAEDFFHTIPAPDTGAREVVTGRRPDALGPLWRAWQGRWNVRTDDSGTPAPSDV